MVLIRYIGGFLLSLVIFPVVGLFTVFTYLGCAACTGLNALWTQFKEIWFSISDPAHIPNIGISGIIRMQQETLRASADAEKGNWESAVRHWKKAASLYHISSMVRLGECYEFGKGVTVNCGAAYEYYSRAALYGSQEGQEACLRLKDKRFSAREQKEFAKTIWD